MLPCSHDRGREGLSLGVKNQEASPENAVETAPPQGAVGQRRGKPHSRRRSRWVERHRDIEGNELVLESSVRQFCQKEEALGGFLSKGMNNQCLVCWAA